MAKLVVAMLRDRPVPGKSALLNVPLEERVEYALNCIAADHDSAEEARTFLHKVRGHLDNPELSAKVDEVLDGSAP